jgi:hypothetical protein
MYSIKVAKRGERRRVHQQDRALAAPTEIQQSAA